MPILWVRATPWVEPDGGTRVDQAVDAEPSGLYKLAGPLLASGAKRDMQNHLDNLRGLMEGDAL